LDMENPWGKIILAGLAGLVAWKSLNPDQKQKVGVFLEQVASVAQQARLAREQQQQRLALPPGPALPTQAAPPPSLPPWVEAVLLERFPDQQPVVEASPAEVALPPLVEPDAKWREVIIPPAVALVLGKRGSGKSALAYRLLELFRHQLTPYVVGAPDRAKQLLPDWIGIAATLEELPNKSVALIDEAYLAYHARESLAQESKAMSQMLNLSRQREQTLIFVAQEARQVDKNIASAASVLIFKELGMLQPQFERPELRQLAEQAGDALSGKAGDKRKWAYVYSTDADFLGLLESQLASFWKSSLSRLFTTEQALASPRKARTATPQDKAQMAQALREQGLSYSQIAQRLGVSKSTVVNYLKNYPYKG
jgi:hypothetical protein